MFKLCLLYNRELPVLDPGLMKSEICASLSAGKIRHFQNMQYKKKYLFISPFKPSQNEFIKIGSFSF